MRSSLILNKIQSKLDFLMGITVVAAVFSLIFAFANRKVFDSDIWLHLKAGEIILQNNAVPAHDIFSFTFPGKPWVDHEWLFQIMVYFVYSLWHSEGLIILESYVIIVAFFVLFMIGARLLKSYTLVSLLVLLAAYASLTRFNIRPDIFSVLFFALYLYILRFGLGGKSVWLLIPVQVLWVNIHGYFFLGPLIVLFFIAAEFIRQKAKFLPWQWSKEQFLDKKSYKRLIILFPLLLLAGLLNPQGLNGALYPVYVFKDLFSVKNRIFFEYIHELQPTFNIFNSWNDPYCLIVILCFSLLAVNFRKLKLIDVLVSGFFFLFALKARNVVFFIFAAYPVIFSYLSPTAEKLSYFIKVNRSRLHLLLVLARYGFAAICSVWIAFQVNKIYRAREYNFDTHEFESPASGVDYSRFPKKAVDFVLSRNIPANMLNDFNSGAYLIGTAYPRRKVFIDGRTEFYGPDFFKHYNEAKCGDVSAFEDIVAKYKISAVFFNISLDMPRIISHIYKSPRWKLIFLDDTAVVFLEDAPANQDLIRSSVIDLGKYPVPPADIRSLGLKQVYPGPYIKRAKLFELIGENDLVISEAKEALRIMPGSFNARYLLGRAYLNKKSYNEAIENLRSALLTRPGDLEALTGLGECFRETKEYVFALKVLKGAIKFNSKYVAAYYQLGRVHLDMDNLALAINALNKAVKYSPKNPDAVFYLGVAIYKEGKAAKDKSKIMKAKELMHRASKLNVAQDQELARDIENRLQDLEKELKLPAE